MYLLCDAFCKFSSFAVCSAEMERKMAVRYFFNGDQLAKVVPVGTCFLVPQALEVLYIIIIIQSGCVAKAQ